MSVFRVGLVRFPRRPLSGAWKYVYRVIAQSAVFVLHQASLNRRFSRCTKPRSIGGFRALLFHG